jgi:hypothetical protein
MGWSITFKAPMLFALGFIFIYHWWINIGFYLTAKPDIPGS